MSTTTYTNQVNSYFVRSFAIDLLVQERVASEIFNMFLLMVERKIMITVTAILKV